MLNPTFNDLPGFSLSAEEQRQRALRSVRHAARTKRVTALTTPASTSPPLPPPPPTPRQVFDPLNEPARRMVELELARKRQTEQEWRTRLGSVTLKPERDGH